MGSRVAVLDMPGYGYASRDDWGREIITYLRRRKQLRRAFVLVDALHGFKRGDVQMVNMLRKEGISYQIVVSKADRLLAEGKKEGKARLQEFLELLRRELIQPPKSTGMAGFGEILAVGNLGDEKKAPIKEKDMLGIEQVRWAVLVAAGLEEWATKRANAVSEKKEESAKLPEDLLSPATTHQTHAYNKVVNSERAHPSTPTSRPSLPPHSPRADSFSSSFSSSFSPTNDSNPSTTSSSFSSTSHYNPVGGLSELEAVSSPPSRSPPSRNSSSRSAQRGRKRGGSSSRDRAYNDRDSPSSKGSNGRGSEREERASKSESSQSGRGEKRKERMEMEMEGSTRRGGGGDSGMHRGRWEPSSSSSAAASSTFPSAPFPTRNSRPSLMVEGKGVGGMADLLAASPSRPGKGTARGRAMMQNNNSGGKRREKRW